ncbi:hypothetical protein C8Q77DRAFT_542145 [Trametes polyzona]|nr:hypothetical protein C8Q77DRAFT_542145 [Trametes polyzona]
MSGMIPRPRSGPISRRMIVDPKEPCLARQMRLADSAENVKLYYEITDTVGMLCEQYLPHTKDMPGPGALKRTVHKLACQAHPILEKYEDLWPIPVMITMHRQWRRGGSSTGITRRGLGGNPFQCASRTTQQLHKTLRPTDRRPRLRTSGRASETTHIINRRGTISMDDHLGRRQVPESQGEKSAPDSTSALDRDRSTTLATEFRGDKSCKFVLEFLQALPQDLSSILPVFERYGVNDEAAVRGLLSMKEWRRWMYGWVSAGQLTEFQYKMVTDGFDSLL